MNRTTPLLSALLVIGLTGGCAGPGELDAEPDRVINEPVEEVRYPTDPGGNPFIEAGAQAVAPAPNPPGPADRVDLLNARKLDALPDPVVRAFNQRFTGAAVTSVNVLDAATGMQIYEINFMDNRGRFYDVLFRPNGEPVRRKPIARGTL